MKNHAVAVVLLQSAVVESVAPHVVRVARLQNEIAPASV